MSAHVIGIVRSATALRELVYADGAVATRPLAQRDPLWRHWRALAATEPWDARDHAQAIVAATVPGEPARELPALPEPPVPWRPTAAHPRAYRGTKDRPPKARRRGPIDLRPYLFGKHLDQLDVRDPTRGLDPWSAMYLWPLGRDIVQLARAFDLPARPELYAALVGVYFAAGDPIGWWSHVLAHPREQQLAIARLVVASGIAKQSPAELGELPARLSVYRAIAKGATPAYIGAGIALDALTDDELPAGTRDVTDVIAATVERLEAQDYHRRRLWRLCGEQPALAAALPALAPLTREAARWAVRLVDSEPRVAPALRAIGELAACVTSAYQAQFVEHMADVVWCASENHGDIARSLAECVAACMRIARPPFSKTAQLGNVIPAMRALHAAPESSWLALEAACKRANRARILSLGLSRIAKVLPALLERTFAHAPNAVIETADHVAALSFEAAERVLREYAATPLATLGDAPLDELVAAIDPVVRAGGPNPVRRELRRHLAGERVLTAAQVAGHRARIVRDLDLVRLAAIRRGVEQQLAARVGAERITPTVRHAVALINSVEKQRRQLRRLIRACVAGDRDWRRRHPESAAWLARHPKLRSEVWFGGHELVDGGVRLAIETDPLEALQLGTHVGSCLGRGGGLVYSAAATVLDVNKHVVFARDAHGAVIGRQVVAVSEADELVCFSVYGARREALEPLFERFDRELAERLGLPRYASHDTKYEIAMILSHEWWDDCVWVP